MTSPIHIWPAEPAEDNGKLLVSAIVESGQGKPVNLWFSLPAEMKVYLTEMSDPFVIAAIFYAMEHSNKMVVHGNVSPSLLRNIEEFQAVWTNWAPEQYKNVEITADNEIEEDFDKEQKAVMAFSGGLDSCFTAYRHKTGKSGRQQLDIEKGIMVHGFDIDLKDEITFKNALKKNIAITKSINMDLIAIATNFRQMKGDWHIVHAAGIAAALSLFSRRYKYGVIASSFSYDSFDLNIPWGSNPLTDNLLSSKNFEIINDGSRYNRTDKLELLINWQEAMDNMRVCWQGEKLDSNCCRCEKCIRVITSFYALGMEPSKCFSLSITNQQIENVIVPDLAILFEYKCMLWKAKEKGIDAPWVKSLEKCIRLNEQRLHGKELLLKKIRRKIAVRTRLRKLYNSLNETINICEGAIK